MQLAAVRQGRGNAVVVSAVAPGSEAAAAGCRPGQQLLAVSDPVRRGESWRLDGNSSLRYVRQAVRMRVAETITLLLTAEPIPEWGAAVAAAREAQRTAAQPSVQPVQELSQEVQQGNNDLLSNIVKASMDASYDYSDDDGASFSSSSNDVAAGQEAGKQQLTVAQRLEAEYQASAGAAQEAQSVMSDVERRQRRRREYFDQVSRQLGAVESRGGA